MSTSSVNKRIARNTIMLYIRMLVVTLISLVTVRYTLKVLGADDYGIYNAVAGVIGFIGFISATLTNSAQRYLAYDIGTGDDENYRHTFSMLMIVFIAVAILIVFVAESLGPWIIGAYLVIPQERLFAAQLVFQISLLSLIVRFVAIPYNASIVAYEKMSFYAYMSIVEVVLKLMIVVGLFISPWDKLVVYTVLLLMTDVVVSALFIFVCLKKFPNCQFKWYWNKARFKEIGAYIGWNTFGSLSASFQTQAVTMVTSMFFAPVVLASRAIADRVNSVSYSFVTNFIMASSPQMVKYYASGDKVGFNLLFYRISGYSYKLMLIIAMPLILLMPELLSLWLADTLQDDMVLFSRLTLISACVSSLETPISRAIAATGEVRLYQIVNCIVAFIGIPIIFVLFKLGLGAEWGYVVCIGTMLLSIIYRLLILKKYAPISITEYSRRVIIPNILITATIIILAYLILLLPITGLWSRILLLGCLSLIIVSVIVFLSLDQRERVFIKSIISKRFKNENRE